MATITTSSILCLKCFWGSLTLMLFILAFILLLALQLHVLITHSSIEVLTQKISLPVRTRGWGRRRRLHVVHKVLYIPWQCVWSLSTRYGSHWNILILGETVRFMLLYKDHYGKKRLDGSSLMVERANMRLLQLSRQEESKAWTKAAVVRERGKRMDIRLGRIEGP